MSKTHTLSITRHTLQFRDFITSFFDCICSESKKKRLVNCDHANKKEKPRTNNNRKRKRLKLGEKLFIIEGNK